MVKASSSLKELDDRELLRATSCDPEAFGVFYDRHVDDVFSFFQKRTSDHHTSADLTAETFAEALRSSVRYDSRLGEPKAWLFGIAFHQVTHHYRHQNRKARSILKLGRNVIDLDDHSMDRVDAMLDASPYSKAVLSGLKMLSPSVANAVVLRIVQQRPFNEVALMLGCSPQAARVRVSRGISELARQINV